MKRITVRVTDDMSHWLEKNFPHGFKQNFVQECFNHLRQAIEEGRLPPTSIYSAHSTIRTIEENIKSE